MAVLFESIKGFFFMMTVIYAWLLLKGELIFSTAVVETLSKVLMPGYLVFCWVIVGYMISLVLVKKTDPLAQQNKSYIRSFLIGSFLGIGLALISIYTM